MPTFVALLRGVNVGKAKRVPMADLRALVAELGGADVATLLNSGNVVFRAARGTSASWSSAIAAGLTARLDVEVPVIAVTATQLSAIVAANPFADAVADPSRLLVAFAQDPATLTGLKPVEAMVDVPERFAVGARAAYLHCPGGILSSRAAVALLGKAGRAVTTRNWATVLKLEALAAARA